MASGFVTSSGLDLDSIFAPQHSGWPQASATEFFDGSGNDLMLRYAPLSTGSAAANTEFLLASGADLAAIFAAFGSTNVQVAIQPSAISGSASAGSPSGTVTSNTTSCAGAKGGGTYTYAWYIASGSGFSLTTPNSQSCGITGTVSAGQSVTGSIGCVISDGVTSAYTSVVSCSLTNTTPPSWAFGITAAQRVNGSLSWTGYIGGSSPLGSGTNLTYGANTIAQLSDDTETDGYQGAVLSISGFSSDPGAGWFVNVVANGKTHVPSGSDFSYSYTSGTATWQWKLFGSGGDWFGFSSGSTYPVMINF